MLLLQPSYWCGGGRKRTFSRHETVQGADGERFEREPTGLPVGISMVHLRKVRKTQHRDLKTLCLIIALALVCYFQKTRLKLMGKKGYNMCFFLLALIRILVFNSCFGICLRSSAALIDAMERAYPFCSCNAPHHQTSTLPLVFVAPDANMQLLVNFQTVVAMLLPLHHHNKPVRPRPVGQCLTQEKN